ncbi:twin-arginine translocation pathway signal [Sphingomonas yabuuchiae]|uniref:Twin-arginine translocation pathway signal n=1 Tax=Sphingomonas yabuuchiae TaxID=172044 RepID=A0A147IS64_9SPHN|nr:twin-arginine translocation pathway signal [Sphingomonas yabuuchiae]
MLELVPERATTLGVDTGAHADLRRRLEDRSPAGITARQRFLTDSLKQVARVPRTGLDPATLTSLAVVESAFRTALDGMALPYGVATIGDWRNTPYAVIQNVGAWLDVPQMLDGDQPVRDKADAEAYLARLAAMPAQLEGETVRIRQAREQGLVPPSFLLDKTIKGMTGTIAEAAKADGPLIGPLARKTTAVPGDWTKRAAQIVRSTIVPALERQLAELQAQRSVAIAAPGMNVRPHGPEWYAWGLRAGTTTRRSAADLHAMGKARLADLQAQMDTILRSQGLTQGSVAERAIAYQKRPGIGFPDGDEGRRQIVAYMQGRIDAIRPRLPDAFRRLARGNLEIRRMPVAQEPGAPAAYGGPGTIDGSVPGKVWVNLGDPSIHNRVTIPDLVYHEGIPGHVWQGEYAQKLPLIRSILAFNAYSEGWALYSEQLADELGMYRDDPAGRLGYLMGLAWRAVRLIVDTGIHAIGWSRDKALAEFIAATGLPRSNAESEVDRYCSWPGQACGYEVGRAEIVSQRTRAQKALGPRYDLRDFDQAVVDGGNVPLNVLAENVTRYIDGTR